MDRSFCRAAFRSMCVPGFAAFLLGLPQEALATQVHEGTEGLIVHQIGHIVFVLSMGVLIYWLRDHKLTTQKGWRFVQYAALFFILWNVDAVIVHYLDGRDDLFRTINEGTWHGHIHLVEGPKELAMFYYVLKMDHLLCLPAVIFLYLGLRHLLKREQGPGPAGGPS